MRAGSTVSAASSLSSHVSVPVTRLANLSVSGMTESDFNKFSDTVSCGELAMIGRSEAVSITLILFFISRSWL